MEDVEIHLRALRTACGYTFRELALLADYPRSSLHRLEHELGPIANALATVARISKALDTPPWVWVRFREWEVPVTDETRQKTRRKRGR